MLLLTRFKARVASSPCPIPLSFCLLPFNPLDYRNIAAQPKPTLRISAPALQALKLPYRQPTALRTRPNHSAAHRFFLPSPLFILELSAHPSDTVFFSRPVCDLQDLQEHGFAQRTIIQDSVICSILSPRTIFQDLHTSSYLSVSHLELEQPLQQDLSNMTAVILPRTSENMTGFNAHGGLDDVHTPSRYIAIAFFCFPPGMPVCVSFTLDYYYLWTSCLASLMSFSYCLSTGQHLGPKFLTNYLWIPKDYRIMDGPDCLLFCPWTFRSDPSGFLHGR